MIKSFFLSCLLLLAVGTLQAQIVISDIYFTSGASVAVEGCNDTLVVELNARVLDDTLTYNVLSSGEAEQNDYAVNLDDNIDFTGGDIRLSFPMSFTTDGIDEGAESLRFNFVNMETDDFESFLFNIYDEMPLEINYTGDTLCYNNTVPLIASGAGEYAWFLEDRNIIHEGDTFNYIPTSNDTIFVIGQIHDCIDTTELFIPFYSDNLEFNENDTVYVCKGETTTLSVSSNNGIVNWSSEIPNILSSTTGESVTVDTDISSYVYVELDGENCIIGDTVYVRVDSLPEYELIENIPLPDSPCTAYCPGILVSLSLNTTDPTLYPDAEFSWTPDNGTIQSGQMDQNALIQTRDTSYYVRTTTNNACESKDSIFIPVIDTVLQFSTMDTIICLAEPRNAVPISIEGPAGLSDISWSPEEEVDCIDDECFDVIITPQMQGVNQYSVEAIVYDCCPTSGTVTIQVEVPPIPIPDVTTCPGEPVNILLEDESGLSDPEWIGATDGLECINCFDNVATVSQDRMFTLEAVDEEGCINRGTVSVDALVPSVIIDAIPFPSNNIGIGGSVRVEVSTIPEIPDTTQIFYALNGEPLEVTGPEANILILEEGENEITITVIDNNGCEAMQTIIVNGVTPEIEIPNAFTPGNNDDVNDIFRPVITNAADADASIDEFRVYNRWGEMVYQFDPTSGEDGWDGNYNGELAPPGVYLYQIVFRLPNGETETRQGDVTLIR